MATPFLRISALLTATLIVNAVGPGRNCHAMDIVSEGKAKATVVVPSNPTPIVIYAAQELRDHIRKATGVQLPIRKENAGPPPENPIYVGPSSSLQTLNPSQPDLTSLPANSFVSHSSGTALFLAGKDGEGGDQLPLDDQVSMGTLFAVYDWLDHALGVRWLWPGEAGTYVPKTSHISAPEAPAKTTVPQLISSRMRYTGNMGIYASQEFQKRSLLENNRWMRRQHLSMPVNPMYNHGFDDYWKRFGKSHPEYFALRSDGVRAPFDHRENLVQMCVSNPELPKQAIADWLQKRTPMRPYINGCENDRRAIEPSCRCAACVAWDVPDAKVSVIPNPWHIESRSSETIPEWEHISLSDRYAKFNLRLLEEGKKHDPHAEVVMMAYSFYSDPPKETKLSPDVITLVVPPFLYPHPPGQEDRFKTLWDGWKSTGATLAYRPNHLLVGYTFPYIYARQFGEDFKHAYTHGMMATLFDSLTGMWGTQGPNLYMHGRLHARPDLSADAVLEEYYSAFGKAAPSIRKYFDHWEEISNKVDEQFLKDVNGGWAAIAVGGYRIFTPETFLKGKKILDEAMAQAKDDEESVQKRLEYLQVWLEYARLSALLSPLHERLKKTPDDLALKTELIKSRTELDEFFSKHQDDFVGIDLATTRQTEGWRSWK